MIVSAVIECQWCGAKIIIKKKKTTRSFNIAFNRLKRMHDLKCETKGKLLQKINEAEKEADVAIKNMMVKEK